MRALETLTPAARAVVRREVRRLLRSSPAFARLSADQGNRLDERITDVVAFLSHDVSKAVDFPKFVAGLIDGVFGAIVDASIQQMEAYASLLADVAKIVDEFVSESESEPKRDRQQVAAMMRMGINRIVVTDGAIRPKVDDDDP